MQFGAFLLSVRPHLSRVPSKFSEARALWSRVGVLFIHLYLPCSWNALDYYPHRANVTLLLDELSSSLHSPGSSTCPCFVTVSKITATLQLQHPGPVAVMHR